MNQAEFRKFLKRTGDRIFLKNVQEFKLLYLIGLRIDQNAFQMKAEV